ncbi:hypothetical protein CBR_g50693 [Chara braunii]|uniref:CCHC-type domain-containing protein n=1 Tax=Chara braunii TaxID=69332 RepID=A0A388M779_CHABU|nr:hypothetical protein CBR_g50693 [Chara braunii]|eukprot:GBG90447.1 hypothetical protein CBR_g50693 [Chara braunii]
MDGDIYDQFGEYIDRKVPGGARAEAQRRVAARQAPPATFRLWQEKEDPPIRVEEVGSDEEVTQRLRAGDIKEEPIVVESEDENEKEKVEPPSVLLGKMEDLLGKAPNGYEQKAKLVLKPFEEEDPWGNKDVQWMMKLALAGSHSQVEEMRTIEEGPEQVERHEELMGGLYLLVNTLLQGDFGQIGSLNPAGNEDVMPESQDDEFEEEEIKETFRAEEYDGIYLERGLLLSCEMRDRDVSDRAQKMRERYLEGASLFSPEQRLEEPPDREMGTAVEGVIEGRPQRLDTPEYRPEGVGLLPRPSTQELEMGPEESMDVPQSYELGRETSEAPSSPGSQRDEKFRKWFDASCFFCEKEGHRALQCPKFLKDLA